MMEGSIPSSSLSTPTPTSSSSPAAPSLFRPRRSEDWNKFRPIIEQLYRDDQLKLKDVKRIMERNHSFVASSVLPFLLLSSLGSCLPRCPSPGLLPPTSYVCFPIPNYTRNCLFFLFFLLCFTITCPRFPRLPVIKAVIILTLLQRKTI